jgi:hypothetical protein
MDHLFFIQPFDCCVFSLSVKEVKEKNARTSKYNRTGDKYAFEMRIHLTPPH